MDIMCLIFQEKGVIKVEMIMITLTFNDNLDTTTSPVGVMIGKSWAIIKASSVVVTSPGTVK